MHTFEDVFFWRATFMLALAGALIAGVVVRTVAAWIVRQVCTARPREAACVSARARQSAA
jgi:hypothetical protein